MNNRNRTALFGGGQAQVRADARAPRERRHGALGAPIAARARESFTRRLSRGSLPRMLPNQRVRAPLFARSRARAPQTPHAYNSSHAQRAAETQQSLLERENNAQLGELQSQIADLKALSIDIGDEVAEQNKLLDNMGTSFGSVENMLEETLKKIGIVLDTGGARHMCYLIVFIVFVFFALYFIMKFRGVK
jgi:blocked-early-in-transport protein 1